MPVFDAKRNALGAACAVDKTIPSILKDVSGDEVVTNKLTVMTFNIQRWGQNSTSNINYNAEIMATIFNKHKPDLVAFQEHWIASTLDGLTIADYLQNCWNGLYVGEPTLTSLPNYTKAISSHYPLKDTSSTMFESPCTEQRSYDKAYIEVLVGAETKRIAVLNTHLDYTDNRYAQITELMNVALQEEYFIILGDLNTSIYTSVDDTDYVSMVKPFLDAGCNCANGGEYGIFNTHIKGTDESTGTLTALDHIITSGNISIDGVIRDTTKLDANTGLNIDHLPLVAYLTVN